jgi:hypothetical protein
MDTLFFLDVKFTNTMKPQMLSMGMAVAGFKIAEQYFELDLNSPEGKERSADASEFVHEFVLPQWGRVPSCCQAAEIATRASRWVVHVMGRATGAIMVAYDESIAVELWLAAVDGSDELGKFAERIQWEPLWHLRSDTFARAARDDSLAASWKSSGIEAHHALAEARALRAGFLAAG